MIKLQNVTKFYKTSKGKKYILKNVTLDLPEGKNIGILGINGAGKSTFLRILGGIDFPNSGKVISDKTFSWPMGLGGGFQGSMTGKQNVRFVARIFGKDDKEINKIIEFVKNFSELGDYFDMPIKYYSSGMRSRLNFSLSLAFDFDYLLIDETLSVGDARFKQKSKDALMKKMEKSNVLMVSHSMGDLKKICDIGIVLHEGNIEYYDKIDDAINRYSEINLYYGVNNRNEIIDAFYFRRDKFLQYVEEAFLVENDECFELYFMLKYINRYVKFDVDEMFICEKINPVIRDLCTKMQDDKSVENQIITHFTGFLKRFNTKVILQTEQNEQGCLLKSKKAFFKKRIENQKLKIVKNKQIFYDKLNKMEPL